MVNYLVDLIGKTMVKNIVIGIIILLLILILDAKNDVRRAEERALNAELRAQKSDQTLAKTERECSERLGLIYEKLISMSTEVGKLQKIVKRKK